MFDTFITGLAPLEALQGMRAGASLRLEWVARERLCGNMLSTDGQPLGTLPPTDVQAVDDVLSPGAPLAAWITAVVPMPFWPQVQLRVAGGCAS